MADSTLTKILELADDSHPKELRLAALRVLGAVGSAKEKPLGKSLLQSLDDADGDIRCQAIEAIGQLKIEDSLTRLEAFVQAGGLELEPAVMAASQLGARGTKAMSQLMDSSSPGLRLRIGSVLAKSGTGGGLVATAHTLLDDNPILVESAARSLAKEVPGFSTAQRHALAKYLIECLEGKRARTIKAEAAMIRVLGNLHEAKAEELFWARVAAPVANEVRVAALQALGPKAGPGSDAKLQKLLSCALEKDFQLVAPALVILQNVEATAKNVKHWLPLLDAPDLATRNFALDRLQSLDRDDVAKALLAWLRHPDRQLRERALKTLLDMKKGRQLVLARLLESESIDDVWFLARALATRPTELTKGDLAGIFDAACAFQDADDRRASPLWHLAKEADHDGTRDRLLEKAQTLRKKKKYAEALRYFRLLLQDPACAEDVRFEFAAAALKESPRDLASDARKGDPPIVQFTRLLQNAAFDLLGELSKAKWLDPEDLFYLGFHFVEQMHRTRDFGKAVLDLVVARSPKSELAKQAKRKLKAEGF